MKKRKPFAYHKPVLEWFKTELALIGVLSHVSCIPANRYDAFAIKALAAMGED